MTIEVNRFFLGAGNFISINYSRITSRTTFLRLVVGKTARHSAFGPLVYICWFEWLIFLICSVWNLVNPSATKISKEMCIRFIGFKGRVRQFGDYLKLAKLGGLLETRFMGALRRTCLMPASLQRCYVISQFEIDLGEEMELASSTGQSGRITRSRHLHGGKWATPHRLTWSVARR